MPSVFWINALKWGRSRTAATDRTDARVASRAGVAELVDARRSGRRELTLVEVRVLSTALARATLSHPEPPSSRGLGRRPLTAETGVRIPVAVLRKRPWYGRFHRSGLARLVEPGAEAEPGGEHGSGADRQPEAPQVE